MLEQEQGKADLEHLHSHYYRNPDHHFYLSYYKLDLLLVTHKESMEDSFVHQCHPDNVF
jgi:hypothetical protein